jgi:hypothetical protein
MIYHVAVHFPAGERAFFQISFNRPDDEDGGDDDDEECLYSLDSVASFDCGVPREDGGTAVTLVVAVEGKEALWVVVPIWLRAHFHAFSYRLKPFSTNVWLSISSTHTLTIF